MTDMTDKFFACLIRSQDARTLQTLGNISALFQHIPTDKEAWAALEKFYRKYNKLPDPSTFEELTDRKLGKSEETLEYWRDKLYERHVKKTMIKASQHANELMQKGETLKAFDVISQSVEDLRFQKTSENLFDFREAHDLIADELRRKRQPNYGIRTGWDTLDAMMGSLRGGDLFSIIGLTGAGKTWMLLWITLYIWRVQKKPVLFVSMEMSAVMIFERLAAMYQKIPYNWVKHGEFSTFKVDQKKKFLDALLKLEDPNLPPLYVVDGNMTETVESIGALAKTLEVDAVAVDGAYLCDTEEMFRKGNERVGYVCKYLKRSIAAKLDIPVLATWQFNKDAMKLKKGQKIGLDNIGDSYEIPRTSSICMGFFQEENAGTIKRRRAEILKGRSGEAGEFDINWDFRNMDFSEIEEIEDYEVLIT